ncbi:hypothetical protein DPEC_G00195770 [Dallia pectoralis]|uniref:Uncharacterized protein n=1 Tax=Dallia pectoralis TaxID=75939 RepID=A0ACC2G7I2_DALPE|nr:hypothetical protein DPEC_G00195770 [Dallia pectoralis]
MHIYLHFIQEHTGRGNNESARQRDNADDRPEPGDRRCPAPGLGLRCVSGLTSRSHLTRQCHPGWPPSQRLRHPASVVQYRGWWVLIGVAWLGVVDRACQPSAQTDPLAHMAICRSVERRRTQGGGWVEINQHAAPTVHHFTPPGGSWDGGGGGVER